MRLPYAPLTPSSPSFAPVYNQLLARRNPHPLLALDRTLLHSPPVASGWSSFLGSIRTQTSLEADVREICICRVAALNGAKYEWEHHVEILRDEGGVGAKGCREVRYGEKEEGGGEVGLNQKQWAVMAYTDAMTTEIRVEKDIFERLKEWFGEREIVEVTATVAAYNCVSRFLVALDVGEMSQRDPDMNNVA